MAIHIDVPRMTDATRRKREYDDRPTRVRRLIDGLLLSGIVPKAVSMDGLVVEIAEYRPSMTARVEHPIGVPRVLEPGLLERAEHATADSRAPMRSYRAQAREDLRRRTRGAE